YYLRSLPPLHTLSLIDEKYKFSTTRCPITIGLNSGFRQIIEARVIFVGTQTINRPLGLILTKSHIGTLTIVKYIKSAANQRAAKGLKAEISGFLQKTLSSNDLVCPIASLCSFRNYYPTSTTNHGQRTILSKTQDVTAHYVFKIYNKLFKHLK
ncbi:hypothetical protein N7474_008979, partial [Penicillium riverlandense]|uniref:uncharacterized protein n=1 Tax=Penicillium riverlandense TaxID=1903569 RepID=UPI0025471268